MVHLFNTRVAEEVGIAAAVIAYNIDFWIVKNKANKKHFINGRYWTYNSVSALAELFPYLTENQIRYAIDKLISSGYLVAGDFSTDRFNRPAWYSLESKYYELIVEDSTNRIGNIHKTDTENSIMDSEILPRHTDITTDSKHNTSSSEVEVVEGDLFADDDNADIKETNNTPPSNNNVTNITPEEFVALYHQICPTLPKVSKLTNKRRDAIKRRIREMGDMATITNVLKKLNNSDFCRGVNQNKWKADFDWLVKNDTIWVWILEGKYDNKGTTFSPAYNAPQQAPITEITDF